MTLARKLLRLSAVTAASTLLLSNLHAKDITAQQPPPTPKEEHAPAPRDGYLWGQGHWEWSGRSYFWVTGNWVAQRRGMRFIPDHWDPQGDQWHFVAAHWEHS